MEIVRGGGGRERSGVAPSPLVAVARSPLASGAASGAADPRPRAYLVRGAYRLGSAGGAARRRLGSAAASAIYESVRHSDRSLTATNAVSSALA